MLNPSLTIAITAAMEAVINTALRYDPASRQQIATITDILSIKTSFATSNLDLYIQGCDDGIRIMGHCEQTVTSQLSGKPLALLSLIRQPTNLANSGIEFTGSIGLLQQWQQLLAQLDIDWEDAISSVLGDIAGPLTASGLRKGVSWKLQQHKERYRLLKEYLSEELHLIPSKAELHHFYDEVSQLTLDTDRTAARLQRLKQRLASNKATQTPTQNDKERFE